MFEFFSTYKMYPVPKHVMICYIFMVRFYKPASEKDFLEETVTFNFQGFLILD
jgi:hypothetical protein